MRWKVYVFSYRSRYNVGFVSYWYNVRKWAEFELHYLHRISHETGWQKKSSYGEKSSKSMVSYANRVHFFILLSHSFSWNCRIKMAFLWQVSVSKVEFWASFMKPWYWHKMLKLSDSAGKKLKLTARGFAAAVSFNFFRPNWQFQHFSQITVSWNCPKIQLLTLKLSQKMPFLSTVSAETGDKKKKNPVSI